MADDNHSTFHPAIVNLKARFEREINEMEELLLRIAVPSNKEKVLDEIKQKLDLIYAGLDVFMDDEINNLSRAQKAEVELLQRHVLNLKLNLESKSISELIALLQSLHRQMQLLLD